MSRIKLLQDVVADVQALSESLSALVQAMVQSEIGNLDDYETIYDLAEDKQADEVQLTSEPTKAVTFEELRAALAQKSREGHTADVKALLSKFGANKLSELQKKDYAAVLTEAEAM